MKHIWIVNYYSVPPKYAHNIRHLEFAKHLQAAGYNVTIVAQGILQGRGLNFVPVGELYSVREYEGLRFVHIKTDSYVGNGFQRMKSIYTFAKRVCRVAYKLERPDVILHNIHAPFDYPICVLSCKLKATYIAEAWDLWPEAFERFGLVGHNNPLLKIAYCIEKQFYKKADAIIFSMEGGIDYLRKHKWTSDCGGTIDVQKIYYINNGIDITKFELDKEKYQLNDADLTDNLFKRVIYIGSINMVNKVQLLIDAAKLINDESIRVLIYGNGKDRDRLESYCRKIGAHNVIFKEKNIPFENVAYVVSQASLNVMNYQKGFGRYGVSSGKLFQYLAAGKPILCNVKLNYSDIERYNLGIDTELDSPEKYADAICRLVSLPTDEYDAMCNRVIETAKRFDYNVLSQRLIDIIEA